MRESNLTRTAHDEIRLVAIGRIEDPLELGTEGDRVRRRQQATARAGAVTVSAQAKGAGMIEPGFATMLCFVQTDAQVAHQGVPATA